MCAAGLYVQQGCVAAGLCVRSRIVCAPGLRVQQDCMCSRVVRAAGLYVRQGYVCSRVVCAAGLCPWMGGGKEEEESPWSVLCEFNLNLI